MSIIVRGMEMPEKCLWCPLQYIGFCQVTKTDVNSDLGRRADDCPLVELPEKHGRLIDADAFFSRLTGDDFEFSFHVDGAFVNVTKINDIFRHQPTVIEAEDEG